MNDDQELERMRIDYYEDMSGEKDPRDPWAGVPEEEAPRRERHAWIVAVYLEELGYGGPEEGGWWYDAGSLTRIVRTFASEARAYRYSNRLNRRLRSRRIGPNQGKREKSSVLSDGVYEAHVCQDYAPQHFPETRPHFE